MELSQWPCDKMDSAEDVYSVRPGLPTFFFEMNTNSLSNLEQLGMSGVVYLTWTFATAFLSLKRSLALYVQEMKTPPFYWKVLQCAWLNFQASRCAIPFLKRMRKSREHVKNPYLKRGPILPIALDSGMIGLRMVANTPSHHSTNFMIKVFFSAGWFDL